MSEPLSVTEQTRAASFAAAFADYACEKGADRQTLLSFSGLSEGDLSNQDDRIPMAFYQALIGAAIHQTGDTALLLKHTLESRLESSSNCTHLRLSGVFD